jgi:hypothetical protein
LGFEGSKVATGGLGGPARSPQAYCAIFPFAGQFSILPSQGKSSKFGQNVAVCRFVTREGGGLVKQFDKNADTDSVAKGRETGGQRGEPLVNRSFFEKSFQPGDRFS